MAQKIYPKQNSKCSGTQHVPEDQERCSVLHLVVFDPFLEPYYGNQKKNNSIVLFMNNEDIILLCDRHRWFKVSGEIEKIMTQIS